MKPSQNFETRLNRLKRSRFGFIFKRNSQRILYHSILMKYIKLTPKEADIYENFNNLAQIKFTQKTLETLISSGLLIKEEKNESLIAREHYKSKGKISISMMYLLTTDGCNLRCKYCFENLPQNHKPRSMSIETALKGVDLFFALSEGNNERTIIFYGGEPLLNEQIVKRAVSYIRQKDLEKRVKLSIVTNGILLNPQIAKFFAEGGVNVSVSLDGDKKTHDSVRLSNGGFGTFDLAKEGYLTAKANGCEMGISLTISSANVDRLKENVEYLSKELNPSAFGFNFLLDLPNCKNSQSVPIEYATIKYIEAFKFLREKGIFEDRAMRKIKPFVKEYVHLKDCGGVGNQIVVSPEGKIGPCHAFFPQEKYFYASIVKPEDVLNNPNFIEWSSRYPLNMPQCINCEALGICGGGCPYQAYVSKGSIWELDERMCKHNKDFLRWLVWDIYDANSKSSV